MNLDGFKSRIIFWTNESCWPLAALAVILIGCFIYKIFFV